MPGATPPLSLRRQPGKRQGFRRLRLKHGINHGGVPPFPGGRHKEDSSGSGILSLEKSSRPDNGVCATRWQTELKVCFPFSYVCPTRLRPAEWHGRGRVSFRQHFNHHRHELTPTHPAASSLHVAEAQPLGVSRQRNRKGIANSHRSGNHRRRRAVDGVAHQITLA